MNEIALPLCSISNWVQVQIGVYGSAGKRVWRAPGVIAHDIPLFSSTGMCPKMELWPTVAASDDLQRVTPPPPLLKTGPVDTRLIRSSGF